MSTTDVNARSTPWQAAVQPVVEAVVSDEGVPGLVVAVVRRSGPPEHLVVGVDAAGCPLGPDTLFPVASITKLATALAVLRLADAGTLAIDDALARHVPDAEAARDGVTVRMLLSHTAGLPDDLPEGSAVYGPGLDWPALARACLQVAPMEPPRSQVRYSNLGFGLLAVVVERLVGRPFPEALRDLVLEPLGIEGYLGTEPPRPPARIAGVDSPHIGTTLEPFNSAFWRSLGLPWGGLVTTAEGALALVRAFAGMPDGFLRPQTAADATRDEVGELGGGFLYMGLSWPRCPWGLGPELRGAKTPHWMPHAANPGSFGHAGHSGCGVWYDPAADIAAAILGARTIDSGWWLQGLPAIGEAVRKN